QVLGHIMIERVPELLRLEHDREGRIARDVDLLERVHLHCDAERHGGAPKVSLPFCHPCQTFSKCFGQRPGTTNTASIRTSSPSRMKRGVRRSAAVTTRRRRHSS